MVASIIMYSLSASLTNNRKMRSKTPLFAPQAKRERGATAILKVAAAPDFRDSQIVGKMIHHMDEAVAVPSGGFESRLRRLSGSPEGARRQYRHGGFRPVGLRDVFHAERFFPILSACSGERPGPFKLSEPVRHRENSVRQLHPRHARRSGPGAARALLRASGISAGRAAFAPGLWQTGWQNARRLGWNRVLLLAKARLPALPHAQALQRQG